MQIDELIGFVFDDATGPFYIFEKGSENDITFNTPTEGSLAAESLDVPMMDLTLENGDVVAVAVEGAFPSQATLVLSNQTGDVMSVFVLQKPVPADYFFVKIHAEMPLPSATWELVHDADAFPTADQVIDLIKDAELKEIPDADIVDAPPCLEKESEASGTDTEGTPPVSETGVGPITDTTDAPGSGGKSDWRGATGGDAAPLVGGQSESNTEDAEDAVEIGPEPVFLNDAEVIGQSTPAMIEIMSRPTTFLIGQMFGANDRRNSQDKEWQATTMPLEQWINGFDGDANNPAFGLSRHPVGKNKSGASIVLGDSLGGSRKAKAMTTMHAMGLDIDSGATLDAVIAKLLDMGLMALIYTSHSHGKSGLELKRDDVLRKLEHEGGLTDNLIHQYLRDHSTDRFEEGWISQCKIVDEKRQTPEGTKVVLSTPSLEKFRVILPLADPITIIDLANKHDEALNIWENKITGLAWKHLGFHFDTSCTDPSRLFFTARHPKGAEFDCVFIQGEPLNFDDVPEYSKQSYARQRGDGASNAFTQAAGDTGQNVMPEAIAPSGANLRDQYSKIKDRLLLADLLEAFVPDKVRNQGGEAQGMIHIECPWEHLHSEDGGTACMAMNCDANEKEVFTWFCRHDSCQGRTKLEFIAEAMREDWFPEDAIAHADYLLPLSDDELEDEIKHDKVKQEVKEKAAKEAGVEPDKPKTPSEQALAKIDDNTTEEVMLKFMRKHIRMGIDSVERQKITDIIASQSALGKRAIAKLWSRADKEEADRKEKADPESTRKSPLVNDSHFRDQVAYAQNRLDAANKSEPRLFHYMENLAVIRTDAKSTGKIKWMNEAGFANVLNTVANFEKGVGDAGGRQGVAAPIDVVKFLFADDYGVYPPLRGLVTSPTYSFTGDLIKDRGYHVESGLYYQPQNQLIVKDISPEPTAAEVTKAKSLLIEEVYADFPLGGLTRPEIVAQSLGGDGVAAVTNLVALTLLPFMREMVDGPTPGHLMTKPAPGTGASLLADVVSIITTGAPTPAMAMPSGKEEMGKTLTSILANGNTLVFFDNINHAVDSGELASAMTTPTYSARILGKTQTVETEVRCVWILTGNNVTLSNELVRRLLMIDLDARMVNPEMRTGFKHKDIRGWVTENRNDLVWACLTLIQNWIAQGKKPSKDNILASYENWSAIMGGVLDAAGLDKFMGNREELRMVASDDDSDDFRGLLEKWWLKCGQTEIPVKHPDDARDSIIGICTKEEIELPVRRTRDADGNQVYSAKSFGTELIKYRGRMFALDSGEQVSLEQSTTRSSHGKLWFLKLGHRVPASNVT